MTCSVGPAGEAAMRLALEADPSPELTRTLLAIEKSARRHFNGTLTDSVIGYATLTLFFKPLQFQRDRVEAWLLEQVDLTKSDTHYDPSAAVILPVLYHPSVAPDLEWLADEKGLSIDDVIALHSETTYFAYATGFAPGFCYLGTLPHQLVTPRLATPRNKVPAGSVAIADLQTAVYPCESPGGWRLIGQCPQPLFDLNNTPANLLSVGDTVRFEPMSEADFYAMGGAR
ncbi:MAG: 5-oxoprolinase subunit PxpB [Luminiphilus sp.]